MVDKKVKQLEHDLKQKLAEEALKYVEDVSEIQVLLNKNF